MTVHELRRLLGTAPHPARSVPCPHCGAGAREACTTRSGRHRITDSPVHPARLDAWARTVAVCPACQVAPSTPCHAGGIPLPGGAVHPQRHTEADRTSRAA
ncbi:zinc finger domain-containing protein [Streptantibioticus silvisoli]|uniref:zinc finger domain-containing protein n=1 Tax=Streptantibioticus silvisoli TaxID=2705255 RepID=UPI003FD79156